MFIYQLVTGFVYTNILTKTTSDKEQAKLIALNTGLHSGLSLGLIQQVNKDYYAE